MTAPVLQSAQYDGATLYLIFDRAVSNVSDLGAFTFTVDGSGDTATFGSIDQNAVIGTLDGGAPTTSLTVAYTAPGGGVTEVLEAAAPNDPVATFTAVAAVPYYSQPLVRRAQVAADGNNDTVTIFFSEPVAATGGDLLLGFTIEIADVAIDLTGATASLNADNTELTIDTGSNFAYLDVVDVIYDDGTGDLYSFPSGTIASFTLDDIDNLSTDGLPNSSYPLSYVIKKQLEIVGNEVIATLQVALNPIDIELVAKYGPVEVYTGGTFGITVDNPDGITVVGAQEKVFDGAELVQNFTNCTDVKFATDAAAEWLDTVAVRTGVALGKARATDQSITLAGDTIEAV